MGNGSTTTGITRLQLANKKIGVMRAAHGEAHVLTVGINDYESSSGFRPLQVCANDAVTVRDRFLDIEQLNAAKSHCVAMTSKSQRHPSRGEILRLLHRLSQDAGPENRIVFYFSGHGQRIGSEFHLVPQDAFASDDPSTLIPFREVVKILNTSEAKQKLVIVDACLSGPNTIHLKTPLVDLSAKFLKDYLANTTGTAILASCGIDEESTTQSPTPKLSLFTYYLCEALAGHKEALEGGLLTVNSLYAYLSVQVRGCAKSYQHKQNPVLSNTVQGVMLLADFTAPLLQTSVLDLDRYPVAGLGFEEIERAWVKDVLTEIKKWTYSQEYLEKTVNQNLGAHVAERLGQFAAKISKDLSIPISEVSVEDASLRFPDGGYSISYESKDKKSGILRHTVWFGNSWFGRMERIVEVLDCVSMQPKEMTLELTGQRKVETMIAGVIARGWELESQLLPKEFTVKRGPYRMRCTPGEIRFEGFLPEEIMGSQAEPEKQSLIEGILKLLPASR